MAKNRRYEDETQTSALGVRHVQCLLLFLALFVAFTTRVNVSMAIVAMTSSSSHAQANNSTLDGSAKNTDVNTHLGANNTIHYYTWSEKTKSYVLSSFFWGYFITQIPGGYFARKYGGKLLVTQGILTTAILTILTPYAVAWGNWPLLCAFRFISGLSQGVIFPSIHTILSNWSPVAERNTLGTCAYLGGKTGAVFMLAVSGTLASSTVGWSSIFYVSGGIGLIWLVAWLIWGANSPSVCKLISTKEKEFIENSLRQQSESCEAATLKTPWSKIFTSVPFLILLFVHCAHSWGFYILFTQIPSYIRYVYGTNIKSNALLSALPYAAQITVGYIFCWLSSFLEKHQYCSVLTNRKIFTTISLWIPAISLISLGYVSSAERVDLAVILLIITMGANSGYLVGWYMNHADLSPNFAGILMGITNCGANLMGFLAPLFVGVVVTDETNPIQWRFVFITAGAFYLIGNLCYMFLGSVTTQPWNEPAPSAEPLKFIKVDTEQKD